MCVSVLWTTCLRAKIHYYYMWTFAKTPAAIGLNGQELTNWSVWNHVRSRIRGEPFWEEKWKLKTRRAQRRAWTGSGLEVLQDTCDFFGSGLDLDINFWKKLDQDRIRILVWFYNEIFLRVIQDVTNDGGSVFFIMVFILSVCAALIAINGNSCYFIVNFFWPSGSS